MLCVSSPNNSGSITSTYRKPSSLIVVQVPHQHTTLRGLEHEAKPGMVH